MSINQKNRKGFTIIEVVLVLAIAGLIFLMVFIALPALQRSQRDTQRKNDVSRIMTQLTSYSSNNRGSIPDTDKFYTASGFIEKYLDGALTQTGEGYKDPTTGEGYKAVTADLSTTEGVIGNIYYEKGKICGDDGGLIGGSQRQYAIQIILEGQSAKTPYCSDNR